MTTTETDAALDLVAALDMYAGAFGGDGVVIDDVCETERCTVRVTLSNGDVYDLEVREVSA